MSTTAVVVNVVVGLALVIWVITRQLRTHELTTRRSRIALVLGVVGVVQLVATLAANPLSAFGATALLAGLAAGAAFGVARARTMPVWLADGRTMTRGTAATAALWLAGIAVHIGLDLMVRAVSPADEPVNGASVVLFVAVTLGAQALVQRRHRVPVTA